MKRRRQNGFTLIEVLAAIVLTAIALPVIMRAFSLSTSVGDLAHRRAEAAVLAHSKLNEIVATNLWQSSNLAGDFAPDHPEYHWTAELVNWDSSTLKELDVHVAWGSGDAKHTVSMSTLVETQEN